MIFAELIFIISCLAAFTLYSIWFLDVLFGGEDFPTAKNAIRKIGDIIIASKKQNGVLYDLGSCRGHFVYSILKICPELHVIGIDNSKLRICFAIMSGIFQSSHPIFKQADIFDTNVAEADFVYVYVPRNLLPALEKKLEGELKPGALVITYRIHFPGWRPRSVFIVDSRNPKDEKVYVYQQNKAGQVKD